MTKCNVLATISEREHTTGYVVEAHCPQLEGDGVRKGALRVSTCCYCACGTMREPEFILVVGEEAQGKRGEMRGVESYRWEG